MVASFITTQTTIPGLFTFTPRTYPDSRGFFAVPFNTVDLDGALSGFTFKVEQLSHSRSTKGTIRGIHAEPWDKYIYIARGEVFVAIVDLRPGETLGEVFSVVIPECHGILVPKGCGNSYQVLSEDADYIYAVNGLWQPGEKYPALAYNDPDLAIAWPIPEAIVSDKDRGNMSFAQYKDSLEAVADVR